MIEAGHQWPQQLAGGEEGALPGFVPFTAWVVTEAEVEALHKSTCPKCPKNPSMYGGVERLDPRGGLRARLAGSSGTVLRMLQVVEVLIGV